MTSTISWRDPPNRIKLGSPAATLAGRMTFMLAGIGCLSPAWGAAPAIELLEDPGGADSATFRGMIPVACCFPTGECADLPAQKCLDLGGFPQAEGSACEPTLCAPSFAACCLPTGECMELPAQQCVDSGGTPQPEGSVCEPTLCEPDCNTNGIADSRDIAKGTSLDANTNGIPDECEPDCNTNGIPDDIDIAGGVSADVNTNGIPDECEPDCNTNGIPDDVDIANAAPDDVDNHDANSNGIPDACDIAECRSNDLNHNGVPDEAEIAGSPDANTNGRPDIDENTNGILDETEQPPREHSHIVLHGEDIRDDEFVDKIKDILINTNGPTPTRNVKDAKFFFQQCYGGGILDDLAEALNGVVPWVGGSASRHDEPSWGEPNNAADPTQPTDRWTRPLTGALPGRTVIRALKKAAREDAANPRNRPTNTERPQYATDGSDTARGITLKDPDAASHHAVLLAGNPDGQRHRNDIRKMCELLKDEWGNLNTNGTSVHVLFGNGTDNPCAGSGVPGANVMKATKQNLCDVLEDLGSNGVLGPNEEFVIYVSDHGAWSRVANPVGGGPRAQVFDLEVTVPAGVRYAMRRDPFNVPEIRVIAIGTYLDGTISVAFNNQPLGYLDPAAINDRGQNETVLVLSESWVQVGVNSLTIDASAAPPGFTVAEASFLAGGINTLPDRGWADSDADGDVDLTDLTALAGCLSGPGGGLVVPACADLDIDEDGDVDLMDYQLFQRVFTGPL